jgi:WD40 repeat protein
MVFARHFWPFHAMAMSPDGIWFVTGGEKGTLQKWATTTGAPLGDPIDTGGWVASIAITPDGTQIISGGGDGVRRFRAETGELAWQQISDGPVWAVSISRDGEQVITAGIEGVSLRTGDVVERLAVDRTVYAAAMSPDGGLLVYGGDDGTIHRWNVSARSPVGEPITAHRQRVLALAVTPDGKQIVSAGNDDGTIHRWDTITGAPVGEPLTGQRADHQRRHRRHDPPMGRDYRRTARRTTRRPHRPSPGRACHA